MANDRIVRINSLLKEVISDVIQKEVKNPAMEGKLVSVSEVDTSRDLHYATCSISVIGGDDDKQVVIDALTSAAGFIAVAASKQVRMRYFPNLRFVLDKTVERQARIHDLLTKIDDERSTRPTTEEA